MHLLIFGFGYTGGVLARRLIARDWAVSGVARSDRSREVMRAAGVRPLAEGELDDAVSTANAILVAAPPDVEGCSGLRALAPALSRTRSFPDWVGYLSTTGVYGDRGGSWVFEHTALAAQSPEGARRVGAERDWSETARGMGLTLAIFRLPGIYGPDVEFGGGGRSPFTRLRGGRAQRIVKPGQVFSRIHVEDLARAVEASLRRPRAGGVYNVCDDLPAPPQDVTAYAAGLMGLPAPPETPFDAVDLSAMQERFYRESKRVSNARIKAELGWRPYFPTYREGLKAVLEAEAANGPPRLAECASGQVLLRNQ